MQAYQDIINVYNKVLSTFDFGLNPEMSFSERFAIERFHKKYQVPSDSSEEILHSNCLSEYLSFDSSLHTNRNFTYSKEMYLIRRDLHSALRTFKLGDYSFPQGSEFFPTKGLNSVESRLCRSTWSTSYNNFELYARTVYNDRALRRSAKKRYIRSIRAKGLYQRRREIDLLLYNKYKVDNDFSFLIFRQKLKMITEFTQGSRFTTVPKNNEKRRPINIEPFGNILTQSRIGGGIRKVLLDYYNQDLNILQNRHRELISDMCNATIDLKNASDSISMVLVEFLFPAYFVELLKSSRSPTVDVGDGELYVLNKISSMGNGFTFELMTLILTSACRVLDPTASVYGDDIIISRSCTSKLFGLLSEMEFVVNEQKSFIDGPFRESCGGNYHRVEGYVMSFDFKYCENIHDCLMASNKAFFLSQYSSFRRLYKALIRALPRALHGGPWSDRLERTHGVNNPFNFPDFFITPTYEIKHMAKYKNTMDDYQLRVDGEIIAFKYVEDLKSPTLSTLNESRNWAKLLMYWYANGKSKDFISGKGRWISYILVKSGERTLRLPSIT